MTDSTSKDGRSLQRRLIVLALPIMGAHLLQTIYNLVDTFFLGRLGKEAVSAPSIAFPIIFFLIVFGTGFSSAGTTLISHAKGRGDQKSIDHYVGQLLGMLTLVSLLIGIVGLLLTDTFLTLLRVPEGATYQYTASYMRIILIGMPAMFISFAFGGIMQGIGDSLTPLYIQIVTVTMNAVLDYLLIFGIGPLPAMGVAGAALATVISRAVASAAALSLLFSGRKQVRLRLSSMRPDRSCWGQIIRIGIPSSLGQGISALGFSTVQGIANTFGPAVIAAFGIGGRIIAMFNMPGQGISQAVAILVGQNLGGGSDAKAERTVALGVRYILIFICIGMSITFFYGNYLVKFFVNDPEVISYGADLFRIVSVSVVFFAVFTVLLGAFQGGGDTRPIMALQIFRLWGVRVPAAFILTGPAVFGVQGLWWAMFLSNLIVAVMAFFLYRTGRWKHKIGR